MICFVMTEGEPVAREILVREFVSQVPRSPMIEACCWLYVDSNDAIHYESATVI